MEVIAFDDTTLARFSSRHCVRFPIFMERMGEQDWYLCRRMSCRADGESASSTLV